MSADMQDSDSRTSVPRPISHLMRALSGSRNISGSSRTAAGNASNDNISSELTQVQATAPNGSKGNPFDRFMEILNVKKLRQADASPFPPPYWFGQENNQPDMPEGSSNSGENTDTSANNDPAGVPAPLTPAPDALGEGASSSANRHVSDDVPEPPFLARKIRDLITSMMPAPTSVSSQPSDNAPSESPPPPLKDALLIRMLSSATIMNGTFSKGRQSVFAILDRLKSPWPHPRTSGPRAEGASATGQSADGTQQEPELIIDDDDSSVMLYGPLIPSPDTDSIVELAQSEVISLDDDDEPGTATASVAGDHNDHNDQPGGEPSQDAVRRGPTWMWNFQWPWYGTKGKAPEKRVHVEKKIWVPSRTKISLQVMWWGYRIYLPPPVLQVLADQKLAAAKRAAMFTAALKWLCDHIPVTMLPIQLRPAAVLVQRLLPYVGYIGGFVAWSWSAIKSYDKGNGVVLTTTWLLPVALIPSTWEFNNPPTSPLSSPQVPGTVPLPMQMPTAGSSSAV